MNVPWRRKVVEWIPTKDIFGRFLLMVVPFMGFIGFLCQILGDVIDIV